MARPDSLNGGARVTDEERSRAVAELRKASTGAYSHVDALDVIANSIGVDADGKFDNEVEKETYAALADLIDRPTCQNKQVVYNRTAPKEFRTDNFTCSACGETFCADVDGVNHPIDWAFCPNCGAEVVRTSD